MPLNRLPGLGCALPQIQGDFQDLFQGQGQASSVDPCTAVSLCSPALQEPGFVLMVIIRHVGMGIDDKKGSFSVVFIV